MEYDLHTLHGRDLGPFPFPPPELPIEVTSVKFALEFERPQNIDYIGRLLTIMLLALPKPPRLQEVQDPT